MISIIFERKKTIFAPYEALSNPYNFAVHKGVYPIYLFEKIKDYFENSTDYYIYTCGGREIEVYPRNLTKQRLQCVSYRLLSKEIISFEIDVPPYNVGEMVYLNSTNYYYNLLSRIRDDKGNWIYEVELSNGQEDTYTQEEWDEFEEYKKVKNKEIEDYKSEFDKTELYKREVQEIIDTIKENTMKDIRFAQSHFNTIKHNNIIEVWLKRFLRRITG